MGYGVAQERQEALTWCHKEPLVWNSRSEHTVCSLPLCSGITAWNRPHCFGTAAPAVATKDGGATRQEMIHLRPFWGMISTTETHSTAQGWSWSARRQQLGGLVSWHWVSGSILVCPWYLSSPLTLWLPLLTPWALQGPGKPDACRKDEVGGCWRGGVEKGRARAPLPGAVTDVNSWQQSGTYGARCDTMNVDKTGCWCVHLHTDVHTLPSRSTRWARREGPGTLREYSSIPSARLPNISTRGKWHVVSERRI